MASTLQLAIGQEEDLAVSASGFIAGNPAASNTQFASWGRSVNASGRYPELYGLAYLRVVTAAELPGFASGAVMDPAGVLAANGTFQVVPPGDRAYYCFTAASLTGATKLPVLAGYDYCAGGASRAGLLSSRDSGQGAYAAYQLGKIKLLVVETPVYTGGITPVTVAGRQLALLGWIGTALTPQLVLDRSLQGHPSTAVTFRYHSEFSNAVFRIGKVPLDAQSASIDLHNGWTVETFGAGAPGGVFDNENAFALLFAGILLCLLLAALILVLGSSRARALRLVSERTAQLRGAQAQLVDTARQAGMAEIATNVLHNVGNVLNSVNVSANVVAQKVRGSRSAGLSKAAGLMGEHAGDLGAFLTTDPRGRTLPGYLVKLAAALTAERESIETELGRLSEGIDHIAEIVSAQQSLTGVDALIEAVSIREVLDDALRMAGVGTRPGLVVSSDVADIGPVALDRHRLLVILVNLITNASNAMGGNAGRGGRLSLRAEATDGPAVRISVADNGEGIAAENLTRIFGHGFTTRLDGHGFGLHSSALAATEMGGTLRVHSAGTGRGAQFVLEVPTAPQMVPV